MAKEYEKYDIIEFGSGCREQIHKMLWVVCHLEGLSVLVRGKEVDKVGLF